MEYEGACLNYEGLVRKFCYKKCIVFVKCARSVMLFKTLIIGILNSKFDVKIRQAA